MKRHSKPRREFSKIIVCTVGAVTIFVTAFTCVMVWRTSNTDALAYLIPAIFGGSRHGDRLLLQQGKD